MQSSSHPPVFFIVGPVGHGKTTVRELLCKLTHLKGASCSDVIYAFLAQRRNTTVAKLRELPKESIRPDLIEAGDFMVGKLPSLTGPAHELDKEIYIIPSILIRTLYMNGNNIIDGVRRRNELIEAKERLEWNGIRSLTIYVETPGKPQVADNSESLRDLADEIILNDGTLAQLEEKLRAIFPKHFGAPLEDVTPVDVVDFKTDAPAPVSDGPISPK